MNSEGLLLAGLVLMVGTAVVTDVSRRRIPNWVSVTGLVVALALRALPGDPSLANGLLAAGMAFAFALPFFLFGGLGAGDVKLMTAAAAFLGTDRLQAALLVMAGTGVLMALVAVARRGVLKRTFANLFVFVATFGRKSFTGWRGEESEAAVHMWKTGAVTLPYGVAIAAGALGGWFL
jgi:prepilin peptidase CpaA